MTESWLKDLKPGDRVYIIVEYEDGEVDIESSILIAVTPDHVITAPTINGHDDIAYIMHTACEDTKADTSTDLFSVYPLSRCFRTREDAENALKGDVENV